MLHPNRADDEQRTQLEARKKRLARLYADGLLTETEYAAEARAIQDLMVTLASPFVEEVDLRIGDPIVRTRAVGAREAGGVDPLGRATATFQLPPGRHGGM